MYKPVCFFGSRSTQRQEDRTDGFREFSQVGSNLSFHRTIETWKNISGFFEYTDACLRF